MLKQHNNIKNRPTTTCTQCGKSIVSYVDAKKHPLLKTLICSPCFASYELVGDLTKYSKGVDKDGKHNYCSWCMDGGDLLLCCDNVCHNGFCKSCIERNLGSTALDKIYDADTWYCFVCDNIQLSNLRDEADRFFNDTIHRGPAKPEPAKKTLNLNIFSASKLCSKKENRPPVPVEPEADLEEELYLSDEDESITNSTQADSAPSTNSTGPTNSTIPTISSIQAISATSASSTDLKESTVPTSSIVPAKYTVLNNSTASTNSTAPTNSTAISNNSATPSDDSNKWYLRDLVLLKKRLKILSDDIQVSMDSFNEEAKPDQLLDWVSDLKLFMDSAKNISNRCDDVTKFLKCIKK